MTSVPVQLTLKQCIGWGDRKNDVLFTGRPQAASINIVYFGGDIQDYEETMQKRSSGGGKEHDFTEWNLEATGRLLFNRFLSAGLGEPHVWTIRASKWCYGDIACYENFVPQQRNESEPSQGHQGDRTTGGCLEHLNSLLRSAAGRLSEQHSLQVLETIDRVPLRIIGFSKGGTAVTQLFYSLACSGLLSRDSFCVESGVQLSSEAMLLWQRVEHFYWLDSGDVGGSSQWPISDKHFAMVCPSQCAKLHAHATVYQLNNTMHPWKAEHFHIFTSLLVKYNLPREVQVHVNRDEAGRTLSGLRAHFHVLKQFNL